MICWSFVSLPNACYCLLAVNGVSQGSHNCMRLPSYDGPITDVTSSSMSCNGSPNALDTVSPNVCSVPAGAKVTLRWSHTLTSGSNGMYFS